MKLSNIDPMDAYLQASTYIDFNSSNISVMAKELTFGETNKSQIARHCFEYVRDEIKHTADYGIDKITSKDSEVLQYKTGYCFAKSHLLAALCRFNGIPAGLCYQRLSISDNEDNDGASSQSFCLHGLNAIYLTDVGWYRVDARGNKENVDAAFCPPKEELAFATDISGEIDFDHVYAEPWSEVIAVLTTNSTFESVNRNLPDKI